MRVRRIGAAMMAVALVASLAGCQQQVEEPTLTPTVEPPVIAEAGVLRVGVDLSYPPFAGTDKGVQAGIDIDVAAAIAERLGCRLEVVDVKPAAMAPSLNAKTIDIMLGAVPITDAVLADVATAGSYVTDGPAFFTRASADSSETPLITLEQSASLRIGAQSASASFWALEYAHGEGVVTGFDTLRGAFQALDAGDVDVVASSATVGAYIARDYPGIVFAGQFGDAEPLGVAVAKDAVELEAAVRAALDGMAADGLLQTIRHKWVGNLPQLSVPATPTTD
ncbi:MAG: substrate-binding periplasmic protein [Coriobacteriia bacterium]